MPSSMNIQKLNPGGDSIQGKEQGRDIPRNPSCRTPASADSAWVLLGVNGVTRWVLLGLPQRGAFERRLAGEGPRCLAQAAVHGPWLPQLLPGEGRSWNPPLGSCVGRRPGVRRPGPHLADGTGPSSVVTPSLSREGPVALRPGRLVFFPCLLV